MAQTRPVTFEPVVVRAAFVSAAQHLFEIAAAVPTASLDELALGTWTTRDLIGHAARALVTVPLYLESGAGLTVEADHAFDYAAVFRSGYADPAAIDERARQAGRDLGPDVVAGVRSQLESASEALERYPDDAPVKSPAGVMRLIDYLPCRVFELVVHGEDIKNAVALELPPPEDALTVALCLTAGWAAESTVGRQALLGLTGRGGLAPDFTVL